MAEDGSAGGWVLPDKYSKDLKDENGNPMSKSEFKKRQKAAEKAAKAAEKAAAKAANPQPKKKKQVRKEKKHPMMDENKARSGQSKLHCHSNLPLIFSFCSHNVQASRS